MSDHGSIKSFETLMNLVQASGASSGYKMPFVKTIYHHSAPVVH